MADLVKFLEPLNKVNIVHGFALRMTIRNQDKNAICQLKVSEAFKANEILFPDGNGKFSFPTIISPSSWLY